MENRQMGESHGKVMEFEISLKPEFLFHIVMFRDWEAIVGHFLFFNTFLHFYTFIIFT